MMDMIYFIQMICVSDDYVEIQTRDRSSIFHWLKSIDHEGSSWTVLQADRHVDEAGCLVDITDEIIEEYGQRQSTGTRG